MECRDTQQCFDEITASDALRRRAISYSSEVEKEE